MSDGVEIKGDLSVGFSVIEREFPRFALAALYEGARVIKEYAKSSLVSHIPKATQPSPRFNDTLVDAVRNTKSEGDEVTVHILGGREPGSGQYRTRFFENGTQDRYQKTYKGKKLKKPKYVGKIKPTHFFANSISSSENAARQAMSGVIDNFFKIYGS